jgi:hypothetical protein
MPASFRKFQTILSAFALLCFANIADSVSAAQLNISGTWDLTVISQIGPGPFKFIGNETGSWHFAFEYSGSGNSFVVDSYTLDIAGYQFSTFIANGDNSIALSNPGANTRADFDIDLGTGVSTVGSGTLGANSAAFLLAAIADGTGQSLESAIQSAFQIDGTLKTVDFDPGAGQLEVYTFNLTGTKAWVPEPGTFSIMTAVACCVAWRTWRRRSSRN